MTRLVHILLIIIPPVLIGLFAPNEKVVIKLLFWHIAVIIPISTLWRMKSFGFTLKDIAETFIPFKGIKKRYSIFFREKKEDDLDRA